MEYKYIEYSFIDASGKEREVDKSIFYAMVDNKKIEPVCLFDGATLISKKETGEPDIKYYQGKIVNKVKLNGEEAKKSSSVYVGFDKNSGVTLDSDYYLKDIKITTNYTDISF